MPITLGVGSLDWLGVGDQPSEEIVEDIVQFVRGFGSSARKGHQEGASEPWRLALALGYCVQKLDHR